MNAAPLLAPSVANFVQHGVKYLSEDSICAFARLVSLLAERPTTVLDNTANLLNVLLEVWDTRVAEIYQGEPLSWCAASMLILSVCSLALTV